MLKRKIYNDLLNWKNKETKMCLMIKGARQVGKTYIIDKFARENYDSYIYINFIEKEKYKEIFNGNLDANTIIQKISIEFRDTTLIPNKTLIFLDEIQDCPEAITALKFLTIDGRFDIIASGSLLGINYKEVISYPVGYVEHLEMHSLDFEEFLWANGYDDTRIGYVKEYFDKFEPVPLSIHNKMLDLFKEYIVVGGMPRVVNEFINNHNFAEVLKIQQGIIEEYKNDMAKYASGNDKAKIRECFLSIPRQLAKDYKKFQYKLFDKTGRASKYEGSLMWLRDAGIINMCYNLSNIELPLEGNSKNDTFKVYMKDTGLLMAMLEDGSQLEIIKGNLGIYKGAIYENIIADIFTKSGKKLYYFEKNSTLEIDFVIRYNNIATAVEVKSADNTKSKSLNSVMENYNVTQAIKLSSKNIGESNNIKSIPIYMAMFL